MLAVVINISACACSGHVITEAIAAAALMSFASMAKVSSQSVI